jgi:hypothetical protein
LILPSKQFVGAHLPSDTTSDSHAAASVAATTVPALHSPHAVLPQSIPFSSPFLTPSAQLAAAHLPAWH